MASFTPRQIYVGCVEYELCKNGWWMMHNRQDVLLQRKHGLEMGREIGSVCVSSVCVVGFGRKLDDEL